MKLNLRNWSLRNRKLKFHYEFYRPEMSNLLSFAKFCESFWNISSKIRLKRSCCRSQFYKFAVCLVCILINKINKYLWNINIQGCFSSSYCYFVILNHHRSSRFYQPSKLHPLVHLNCRKFCKDIHQYTFLTQIQFSLKARLQLQDTSSRTCKIDKKQQWI